MNIPTFLENKPALIKRLIALVAVSVFFEMYYNVPRLVGETGIVSSINAILIKNSTQGIWSNFIQFPTIFWLGVSNNIIQLACLFGAMIAFLIVIGLNWFIADLLVWFLFASLMQILGLFVDINDFLLVECLFLMIFFFPMHLRPKWNQYTLPSKLGLIGIYTLIFKLSFGMLLYKIMYKFPGWYDLTILKKFCSNSPTPTPLSFIIYQIPMHYLQICTLLVFVLQFLISVLVFFPLKYRRWAFIFTLLLQIPILLVTNLGATNYLTIIISLSLLMNLKEVESTNFSKIIFFLPLLIYIFVSITTLRTHFNPPESNHLSLKFLFYKELNQANPLEKVEIYAFRYKISNVLARFHGIFDDQRDVEFQYSENGIDFVPVFLKLSLGQESKAPGFFWGSSVVRMRYPFFYFLKDSHLPLWRGGIYDSFPWYENLIKKSMYDQEQFFNDFTDSKPSCYPHCRYYKFLINKYQYTNAEILEREGRWWEKTLIKETPVIDLEKFDGKIRSNFYPDR